VRHRVIACAAASITSAAVLSLPVAGWATASSPAVTIASHKTAWYSGHLTVTGQAPTSDAGTTVQLQRLGRQTGWRWTPTAHAVVGQDGTFKIVWHVNRIGKFEFRAVILGAASSPAPDGSTTTAATSSPVTVTLYKSAIATMYGPGLWGNHTACGQILTRSTLGVANRTLPCGTRVSLLYDGHTITVPVIDRGPYANGADWDLTWATAQRLGMRATSTIGAAPLITGG
jgi:rare lipoprotein A